MAMHNCKKVATNPFLLVRVTFLQCDFEDIPLKIWPIFLHPLNLGWFCNLLQPMFFSKWSRSGNLALRPPSYERAWAAPVIRLLVQPLASQMPDRCIDRGHQLTAGSKVGSANISKRAIQMTSTKLLTHRNRSQSMIVVLSHCFGVVCLNCKS